MFLRFHYGFANYFEISYQEEFHPVKYCLSRISTSRNIKFKRLQNSIFLAFGWFFKFCPQNLWHFEDVPIKCPKKFLYYIEFICRRTFEKKQVWILCLQLASPQNLDVFLENLLCSRFWNHFQAEIISKNPLFLDVLIVFHMVRAFKKGKKFLLAIFFVFLSCHRFTCYEILNFVFSYIIPRGVSTCKILPFCDWYIQKYKALKII